MPSCKSVCFDTFGRIPAINHALFQRPIIHYRIIDSKDAARPQVRTVDESSRRGPSMPNGSVLTSRRDYAGRLRD